MCAILTDRVGEINGGLDDLGDDLTAAHVLGLDDLVLDFAPLVLSALGHLAVKTASLLLDTLDELSDQLIDSIFVLIISDDFKNSANLNARLCVIF